VRLLLLQKTGIPDRSAGYDKYNFLHENILIVSASREESFSYKKGPSSCFREWPLPNR
jgi:hypothetical protein